MLALTMQATTTGSVAASSGKSTNGAISCKVTRDSGAAVELPLHLTEKILRSIMSPLVSSRHATVCKSWACTVSARLARSVPHLFACTPPDNNSDRRGLVVSVPLDSNGAASASTLIPARVRSSDTNGLRCIGATPTSGLVAFAAGWWSDDVVLVNPVTGELERVHVGEPCRLDPRHSRVIAADDVFFAVDGYRLALWRRQAGSKAGEEAWSMCALTATSSPSNSIVSAVNCNGRFYLLRQDGCLATVDATAAPPVHMEKLPVDSLVMTDQFIGSGHLLESDGEVLLVRQLLAAELVSIDESCRSSSLSAAGFQVHRLDLKEQRWTQVNELPADRALFLSPGSSFAVCASDVEGCRSNCIYFVGESHQCSSSSWGLYSMEDRRVLYEHLVVTESGRGTELCWFFPRV